MTVLGARASQSFPFTIVFSTVYYHRLETIMKVTSSGRGYGQLILRFIYNYNELQIDLFTLSSRQHSPQAPRDLDSLDIGHLML